MMVACCFSSFIKFSLDDWKCSSKMQIEFMQSQDASLCFWIHFVGCMLGFKDVANNPYIKE